MKLLYFIVIISVVFSIGFPVISQPPQEEPKITTLEQVATTPEVPPLDTFPPIPPAPEIPAVTADEPPILPVVGTDILPILIIGFGIATAGTLIYRRAKR